MINLVSNQRREDLMYARRNTKLLHWIVSIVLVIAGLIVLTAAGYIYSRQSTGRYAADVQASRAILDSDETKQTETRIQDLSSNLNLIIKVLSNQVLFSQLLRQIGSIMPPGTILSSIEIAEVAGGIDLSAQARDYHSATQVQVNLQDDTNQLFEKVDLVSINCGESDDGYPCTVSLRAEFTKNNPFLFLNQSRDSEARP